MKPQVFTPAQIEYLKHYCEKAAYHETGNGELTRAFPLAEDGREVVAAAIADRFARLVETLGVEPSDSERAP